MLLMKLLFFNVYSIFPLSSVIGTNVISVFPEKLGQKTKYSQFPNRTTGCIKKTESMFCV